MAVPASLFRPAPPQVPGLASAPAPAQEGNGNGRRAAAAPAPAPHAQPAVIVPVSAGAVESGTVIAGTGLLSVLPRIQRIRVGPQHAGQLAHVQTDEHSVHILIGGTLVKTAASNLAPAYLSELRLRGTRPAGPPPAAAAARNSRLPAGAVIEADRAAGSSGVLMLGGARLALGMNFARQRVTLRLDGLKPYSRMINP